MGGYVLRSPGRVFCADRDAHSLPRPLCGADDVLVMQNRYLRSSAQPQGEDVEEAAAVDDLAADAVDGALLGATKLIHKEILAPLST